VRALTCLASPSQTLRSAATSSTCKWLNGILRSLTFTGSLTGDAGWP